MSLELRPLCWESIAVGHSLLLSILCTLDNMYRFPTFSSISPTLPFTHLLAITLLTMMLPNTLCCLCTCHRLAIQYTLIIVVEYGGTQQVIAAHKDDATGATDN